MMWKRHTTGFVGVTYPITAARKTQESPEGNLMSQRRQLRLVFRQSIPLSSAPLKMSLSTSPTRSSRRSESPESTFLLKMRELEKLSPEHAAALGGIADAIFVQILGAPLE